MISTPYGIKSDFTPGKPQRPVRDPEYRRWIKTLPCAKCGAGNCDPSHTGPHGLGQKSSDLTCIPLCRKHHDEYDSAPYEVAQRWKLDVPELIARLNAAFKLKSGRAA